MLRKFVFPFCQNKYFFGRETSTYILKINKGHNNGSKILCFDSNDQSVQQNLLCFSVKPNHYTNFCTTNKKIEELGKNDVNKTIEIPMSFKQKLRNFIKDYGIAILVLHFTLSFISLGCCYILVLSGATQFEWFKHWGIDEGAASAGVAAALILAYAIHKTIAPWRFALTLILVPFAVKKLRFLNFFKTMKPKQL